MNYFYPLVTPPVVSGNEAMVNYVPFPPTYSPSVPLWLGFELYDKTTGQLEVKTFWDWMELLIIPFVLILVTWWLNKTQKKIERELAEERQQQTVLEMYLDRMSDLLLNHNLCESDEFSPPRLMAVAHTHNVLRILTPKRKRQVLKFLEETGLIWYEIIGQRIPPPIHLCRADLSEADLENIFLYEVDLDESNLTNANLENSRLSGVHLYGADLRYVNMRNADLEGADLGGADLRYADLRGANLKNTKLKNSQYNKKTKWPEGFDPLDF